MSGMINNFVTMTVRALFLDNFSLAVTFITCYLALSKHARKDLKNESQVRNKMNYVTLGSVPVV